RPFQMLDVRLAHPFKPFGFDQPGNPQEAGDDVPGQRLKLRPHILVQESYLLPHLQNIPFLQYYSSSASAVASAGFSLRCSRLDMSARLPARANLAMSGIIPSNKPRKVRDTTPQSSPRTARVEARLSPEAQAIVKRAAEIQGRSVSDFVVSAAQEAA